MINNFLILLAARLNEYKANMGYKHFEKYETDATEGNKFYKVFRREVYTGGAKAGNSIVCFVNKETGEIFKPASFNAPAKHARGNINSASGGMEAIDEHGFVKYLRN